MASELDSRCLGPVFLLYGNEGVINVGLSNRVSVLLPEVYDRDTGRWRTKQNARFDGGWRWFISDHDIDSMAIYNVSLDKRAMTYITHEELVNQFPDAEFVLMCAQSRVLVEHTTAQAAADTRIERGIDEALRTGVAKTRREQEVLDRELLY